MGSLAYEKMADAISERILPVVSSGTTPDARPQIVVQHSPLT
jgi:hypothetical protein